jgi:hypothetical protein
MYQAQDPSPTAKAEVEAWRSNTKTGVESKLHSMIVAVRALEFVMIRSSKDAALKPSMKMMAAQVLRR